MDLITPKPSVALIDPNWTLRGSEDNLFMQYDQDVNDKFLDQVKDLRTASANSRTRDFELAADIPTAVVDKWMREGFDIFRESWKAIQARLIKEDLSAFITTAKNL